MTTVGRVHTTLGDEVAVGSSGVGSQTRRAGGLRVVRFYHFTAPTDGFTGVEFRNGAFVGTHRRSTLDEPTEIDEVTEISAVDTSQ